MCKILSVALFYEGIPSPFVFVFGLEVISTSQASCLLLQNDIAIKF